MRVTGFAPLVSVIGPDHPITFQLSTTPGRASGPEVSFGAPVKGVRTLHCGHASLLVEAPPSVASLGTIQPQVVVSDGTPAVSANPADPSRVAWCAPGAVDVSAGSPPVTIPTSGVITALAGTGLSLVSSRIRCETVALPGGHPHTVFAGFLVNPHGDAPPFADVALFTTDGGSHWALVPVPSGAHATTFGGFTYRAGSVEAVFAPSGSTIPGPTASAGQPPPSVRTPLAEDTSDGGRQWTGVPLGCPNTGPCVTFGPYLPGNCAMHGTRQLILYSANAGHTWTTPTWPTDVDACAPAQLVALSASHELLVESASPYGVLQSNDGGRTWSDVSVPLLPGQRGGQAVSQGPGGPIMLPDGVLLAAGQRMAGTTSTDRWELLVPHAHTWCTVAHLPSGTIGSASASASASASTVVVIGDGLWWQTDSGRTSNRGAVHHLAIARLRCG